MYWYGGWNHWCNRCSGVYRINARPPANVESLFPVYNDASTWNLDLLAPIGQRYELSITDTPQFYREIPQHLYAGWVQDDWAVSSRLTLNVTRDTMAEMGWCPSGRLFEAAACRSPVVSDWFDGLDAFFTPGSEILIARDTEEALDALDMSDRELEQIAAAAHARFRADHTSARRAEEMLAAFEAPAAAMMAQRTEAGECGA